MSERASEIDRERHGCEEKAGSRQVFPAARGENSVALAQPSSTPSTVGGEVGLPVFSLCEHFTSPRRVVMWTHFPRRRMRHSQRSKALPRPSLSQAPRTRSDGCVAALSSPAPASRGCRWGGACFKRRFLGSSPSPLRMKPRNLLYVTDDPCDL